MLSFWSANLMPGEEMIIETVCCGAISQPENGAPILSLYGVTIAMVTDVCAELQ